MLHRVLFTVISSTPLLCVAATSSFQELSDETAYLLSPKLQQEIGHDGTVSLQQVVVDDEHQEVDYDVFVEQESAIGTVFIATTPPVYEFSTVPAPNAWQCHAGSKVITNSSECWTACQQLAQSTRLMEKAQWQWPNGCYIRTDNSASAQQQHCIFNIHNSNKTHANYNDTKSICEKNMPTDRNIKVIGRTSTVNYAGSKGNFYIQFPGDEKEYSLYTGGDDFEPGFTDTWPLTVLAGADLTRPTIYIKEHNDAWIPDKITIEEGGVEKFNANGLKVIIDGNCNSAGLQWGNLFCADGVTWPFVEVTVKVNTRNAAYANSDSTIKMMFAGDHRKYVLDNPNKNDFEKGQTDEFKLFIENDADISGPVEVSIVGNDGWVPDSIEVSSAGVTHALTKAGSATLPFWLDGNCPGGTQSLSGVGSVPCKSSYFFN